LDERLQTKVQRAFSIGFIPKQSEFRIINGERVRVHTEIELLELSAVAVPSNRDALSKVAAAPLGDGRFLHKKRGMGHCMVERGNTEYRPAAKSDGKASGPIHTSSKITGHAPNFLAIPASLM
jgi:hypothetical protein